MDVDADGAEMKIEEEKIGCVACAVAEVIF